MEGKITFVLRNAISRLCYNADEQRLTLVFLAEEEDYLVIAPCDNGRYRFLATALCLPKVVAIEIVHGDKKNRPYFIPLAGDGEELKFETGWRGEPNDT